ncbi:hypothetical protein E1898_07975 [Algoriphagus formosus]|uniref:OmpA-like domain-containing protein n=1 Tax=Algoriphagus formosus TaxID=2007308 RepID=A0A4R5V1W1_9BACT|nr:hypothetical protein E1898_07975 [Algoriphagus aquimaris]
MGFADNTGSVSYNLKISEQRVEAFKAYFKEIKISEDRISSDVGRMIV